MRLWSIDLKYLDTKGLVTLWRESLLAKNVLENKTKGYKNHPQLIRFQKSKNPIGAINFYLKLIHDESLSRKYNFNKDKFSANNKIDKINVTDKQLEYEFKHLQKKLSLRDKQKYNSNLSITKIEPNDLFIEIKGDIEQWEKILLTDSKILNYKNWKNLIT